MGSNSYRARGATVAIGHALAGRGWSLVGYKEDRSDCQTDYFDPASWCGIARRNGVLVLCDVSEYRATEYGKPQPIYGKADGPCSRCSGTGQAQESAIRYGFAKPGPCETCNGTGRAMEFGRIVGENPAIQHVRACAGRWIVIRETDGRVLGTGQRPLKADEPYGVGEAIAAKVADDIERAANRATASPPSPSVPPSPVEGKPVERRSVAVGQQIGLLG